jgi:hypothetical protein
MKKTILGFFIMALALSAGLAAPAPGEKTIQFSLGGNFTMLRATYDPDSYFLGAALRVDLNIGRWLSLAPEISAGIGEYSGGATVNVRPGKFFIGAGYLAMAGLEDEWGIQSLFKVHAGYKSKRALLAAAYLSNKWFKGFGLTVGYIF